MSDLIAKLATHPRVASVRFAEPGQWSEHGPHFVVEAIASSRHMFLKDREVQRYLRAEQVTPIAGDRGRPNEIRIHGDAGNPAFKAALANLEATGPIRVENPRIRLSKLPSGAYFASGPSIRTYSSKRRK